MRTIHEKLMAEMGAFGEFEVAPKKGYVSLRRKKQFAMIGPATNTRFEVGLNLKGVAGEVDAELLGWLRTAWEQAG